MGHSSQSFVWDALNRLSERNLNASYYDPPPANTERSYLFSKEQHAYDTMGRLRWTLRTLTGQDGTQDKKQDVFDYNDNGELNYADYDRELINGGYSSPARIVNYALDPAGNRTSVTDVTAGGTIISPYTPNNLNQYSQTGNGSQHEVSAYQGVTYEYLGDTQLASASSGANVHEFGYDALGRRVWRTINGVVSYYAYSGHRSILEYGGNGGLLSYTLYGNGVDEAIVRWNHGVWQLLFQDRLGSTSAIANAGGEIIEQYRYDAFGAPEFWSGPPVAGNPRGTPQSGGTLNNNGILFAGREWVHNFGFYENRARAYHPGLGRFMSEDPLGFAAGDTNLFRYCGNDPVNFTDPSGEFFVPAVWVVGILVGAMITNELYHASHRSPPVQAGHPQTLPPHTEWERRRGGEPRPGYSVKWLTPSGGLSSLAAFLGAFPQLNNPAAIRALQSGADRRQLMGSATFDSHAANLMLMGFVASSGFGANFTGNTGDAGHNIFNTGQGSRFRGRMVDGIMTHVAALAYRPNQWWTPPQGAAPAGSSYPHNANAYNTWLTSQPQYLASPGYQAWMAARGH